VKKEINYCHKANFKIKGIVENMSGFICPYCDECTNIFSKGGGEKLSQDLNIKFLASVPIDPTFVDMIERQSELKTQENKTLVELYSNSNMYPIFESVVEQIL